MHIGAAFRMRQRPLAARTCVPAPPHVVLPHSTSAARPSRRNQHRYYRATRAAAPGHSSPTPQDAGSDAAASQPAAPEVPPGAPAISSASISGSATSMAERAAAATPSPTPASAAPAPSPGPAPSSCPGDGEGPSPSRQVERLKVALLAALSSLDRGLAANAREAAEVDELCKRLEGLGGLVFLKTLPSGAGSGAAAGGSLAGPQAGPGADLLAGTWRLVYSSGFNSGSLGGRRPGPPAALFPTILGQVYQRIDPGTAKLDNIVELLLNYGPLDLGLGPDLLGGISRGSEALGLAPRLRELMEQGGVRTESLPQPLRELVEAAEGQGAPGGGKQSAAANRARRESPAARLTLRHDYEVTSPATVRIVYEETYGELVGSDLFAQLPRLAAPSLPEPLKPPRFLRSASFDVTYLDGSLRITRGDRGELRVYLRDDEAEREAALGTAGPSGGAAAAALDYVD